MNFVGKFDAGLPFAGVHPNAKLHADSVSGQAPSGSVVIKDAQLLFTGDYRKAGLDLVISRDGQEVVVPEYFKGDKRAALASPDGAHLTGDIVSALAGHAQYAQTADGSASAAKVIGHVTKLTGNATVIRNGVSIVLNMGDTVNQGDVVQSGSGSTLGITFIDGSVFGLGSNARMVLNEMVYDPNGSNNSSLLSLVQGTISFVAGATAKHGDMKVDTPVATMGIRGTAVLVEIDFEIPGSGGAPPARFQVLVEPDGTTGSYVLLDKATLSPIATVNQAGTQTTVSGQGVVSFLSSAQLSPEAQEVINKVFALKFTETNPNSTTRFSDIGVPQNTFVQLANGDIVNVRLIPLNVADNSTPHTPPPGGTQKDRVPGPPTVATFNAELAEKTALKGSSLIDSVSGGVTYAAINVGDVPTLKTAFNSYTYASAQHQDVTAGLTAEQKAAIDAVTVPLTVAQDPAGKNTGTATWTYDIADHALDFLAEGEELTLTYVAEVGNNHPQNNEKTFKTFTITITGTNDAPVIETTSSGFFELPGTANSAVDHAGGTITFEDVDLTDRPTVTTAFDSYTYKDRGGNDVTLSLTSEQKTDIDAVKAALTLTPAPGNGHDGSVNWSYDVADYRFDFLAAGEKLTLTYIATVDDHHGGTATVPVTVTVTGTNDVPTIATTASAIKEQPGTTGSPVLDVAQGTVTFTDVDLTDRPVVTTSFGSFQYIDEHGNDVTLSLTPQQLAAIDQVDIDLVVVQAGTGNNGTANWTYSIADSKFDFLADGETLILTYVATVDDGHGGVVSTPITITVTGSADVSVGGTNDVPVVTTTDNAFVEAANVTGSTANDQVTGSITFTDPDLTDTHSVTIKSVASSGVTSGLAANGTVLNWLSLGTLVDSTNGATGSRPWTFTAPDNKFDYLARGEVLTLTYTIEVDDHHGGVVAKPVVVTITGTNDLPIIDSGAQIGSITETADLAPSADADPANATGTITFDDVDLSDVPTASITAASVTGGAALLSPAQQAALLDNLSLTPVTDSPDGSGSVGWTYSAKNGEIDFLGDGDTVQLTFTVTVNDNNGGTDTQDVVITIHGTNDLPIIDSGAQIGSITETADLAPSADADPANATGTITFDDVDLSDVPTASITASSVTGGAALLSPAQRAALLDNLSLTPVTDNPDGSGSVGWTYSAKNGEIDFLGDGDTVQLTFTVTVNDNNGGTATQDVVITIHGSNDAPIIDSGAQIGSITETADLAPSADADPANATGTITFDDVDLSDVPTASITAASVTGGAALLSPAQQAALLDNLSLTPVTDSPDGSGSVGWTYSANNGEIDFLGDGDTVQLTFTVTVNDNNGGTDTQDVVITIHGTNDLPIIDSGAQIGSITETVDLAPSADADPANATGTITFDDVDLSDVPTASITAASVTGGAALLSPAQQAALLDNLSLTPVTDSPDGSGSVGWTYSANNGEIDFLGDGDTVQLTFTVTVNDNNGGTATQDVVITIHGTNDAPTISTTSDAFSELPDATGSSTPDTASGTISFTDVDLIDEPEASAAFTSFTYTDAALTPLTPTVDQQAAIAAVQATLALTPAPTNANDGSTEWVYSVDDSALDFLAADEILTLTYTATVDDGHTTVTQPFTVTITGSNDAPTLDAGTLTATAEDSDGTPQQISGIFAGEFDDVDNGASLAGIAVTGADTGGTGAWWYSDNGSSDWQQIGSVSASAALVLSASAHLKFVPAPDYNGTPPALTVYAIDNTYTGSFTSSVGGTSATVDLSLASSHGGSTPFAQDPTSITTSVTAVNDAPVNTVPGAQSATEDTALIFSSANGNAISVSDVDAGGGTQTVTLTVSHGILTLSQVSGLSFTSGGDGEATMTFTGTLSDINAALSGLSYKAVVNYSGSDTLTIATSDDGNTGAGGTLTDSDSVTIDVAPVADAPALAFELPTPIGGDEITVDDRALNDQSAPQVITLADGRLLFTWQSADPSVDGNGSGIAARIGTVDSLGDITFGYEFTVNQMATPSQTTPQVIQLDDGRVLFVWQTDISSSYNHHAFAYRVGTVDPSGTVTFSTEGAVYYDGMPTDFPNVTQTDDGHLVFSWTYYDPNFPADGSQLWARAGTVDANGQISFGPIGYVGQGNGNYNGDMLQVEGRVLSLEDGRVAFTWVNYGSTDPVVALRVGTLDGNGNIVFGPTSVVDEHIASTDARPAIAQLADGRILATWTSADPATDGSSNGVAGRVGTIDAAGNVTWSPEFTVNAHGISDQDQPAVTVLSDGSVLFVWRSNDPAVDGDHTGVSARIATIGSNGQPAWGQEFTIDLNGGSDQSTPQVVELPDGRLLFTWQSGDPAADGNATGVVARVFELPSSMHYEDNPIDLPISIALTDGDGSESITAQSLSGLPAGFTLTDGVNQATSAGAAVDVTGWSLEDLSITPMANWNGTFTATVSATVVDSTTFADSSTHSDTTTVTQSRTVTVTAVNDAPVITSGDGDTGQVSIVENTTAVTTVEAADVDSANLTYAVVTDDPTHSPDGAKFTIDPVTGVLSFIAAPDYELNGSAGGTNEYTVQVKVVDGAGGVDIQTLTVTVTDDPETPVVQAPALVAQTFLGGPNNQGATDVSYHNGHLYLTWNTLPVTQTVMDNGQVVSFSTTSNGTPTQDFALAWSYGHFNGVASDGTHIYAVGGSHPDEGFTSDPSGGAEVKTMMGRFDVNGVAGSNPAPATDYAATNFFGYGGVEIFQDVVVTTQAGNTVFYAVGHGQPASYGAYVIASYNASSNLQNVATDPLPVPGFSVARDAVEFNGQIWAVGYTEHSGDPVGRATAWAADYALTSVATYKDTVETAAGNFEGAAVIGSNLYAVGNVTSSGNDYLVAKYNTDGSVAWSHSFGGSGADFLTGAVALNGHLYVVGHTTNGGDTDGVLMEISTVDGSVLSTTTYDGALNDFFNSVTTDGQYLYVAGESKSYSVGGNSAPDSDAILLTYDVGGGPVIDTEHFSTSSAGGNTPTTITNLGVSNSNPAETLTLTATTAEFAIGSTVAPSSGSGDLAAINDAIDSVVYDPGLAPPLSDKITFTVSGASGSDTVNFIFIQADNSPNPTLLGTSGKDVIFGTESSDTLTGGAAKDQFVFSNTLSGTVQHTITDFETPLDKIDLRAFSSIDSIDDLIGVVQQGSDTLVHIDGNDSILLQNVLVSNVHAGNFIFHSLLVA